MVSDFMLLTFIQTGAVIKYIRLLEGELVCSVFELILRLLYWDKQGDKKNNVS